MLKNDNPNLDSDIQKAIQIVETYNCAHVVLYISSLKPTFEGLDSLYRITTRKARCIPPKVEGLADALGAFLGRCLSVVKTHPAPVDREDALVPSSDGVYSVLMFHSYEALTDSEQQLISSLAHLFVTGVIANYQHELGSDCATRYLTRQALEELHPDLSELLNEEVDALRRSLSGRQIPRNFFCSFSDSNQAASIAGHIGEPETKNSRCSDDQIRGSVVAVDIYDGKVRIDHVGARKPEWIHIGHGVEEDDLIMVQRGKARLVAGIVCTRDPKNRITKTLKGYELESEPPFNLDPEDDGA